MKLKRALLSAIVMSFALPAFVACSNDAVSGGVDPLPPPTASSEAGSLESADGATPGAPPSESAAEPEPTSEYAEIYISVFDSYFEHDPGLHDGMKYIAIDTYSMEYATRADMTAVSDYLRGKYGVDTLHASFEDLQEMDKVGEGNSLEGILLSVDSVSVSDTEITVKGRKFRSGLGANGFESVLANEGGVWTLKETKMTWIS